MASLLGVVLICIAMNHVAASNLGLTSTPTPTMTKTPTPTMLVEEPQTLEVTSRTIVVDYLNPQLDAATIYDTVHLTDIQTFESRFMEYPQYGSFCLKNVGFPTACAAPQSLISLALESGTSNSTLMSVLRSSEWRPCVGANFPQIQTQIRSFFRFGGPLVNYTTTESGGAIQELDFDKWFIGFHSYINSLVMNASAYLNISLRGGPFQLYEQEWVYYKNITGISFATTAEDQSRYLLFKDNAKRIEYLSSLKPGSDPVMMWNSYMHLTNKEFFVEAYNLDATAVKPPYSTFLMWNIKPDMTDYVYPP